MKRILYYCQSLVGIGHLTSSLRIIDLLLQHAEVDLIQGGLDTHSVLEHTRFRRLKLPTLLHDAGSGGFVDPDEQRAADEVWPERARAIESFLRGRYDALVVEFWPFGRRRFKGEIAALFDALRERSGPLPIFTSVRDVLVPRAVEKEWRMVASVKKHIHTVFVRGDPQIIRFDDTFSLAHEIADRLCYTGCIAPPLPALRPPRTNQILVSQGGGNVGRELIDAAIGAAALMPDFTFLLACRFAHERRRDRRAAGHGAQRQRRDRALPARLPAAPDDERAVDQHGRRQHFARCHQHPHAGAGLPVPGQPGAGHPHRQVRRQRLRARTAPRRLER